MAELAVKAKYEGSGVALTRNILRLTFPLWGFILPLIAIIGFVVGIYAACSQPLNVIFTDSVYKAVAFLFTCSAIGLGGLAATRLIAKNELIVDKSGVRLPLLPNQPMNSMKYITWSNITRLDVIGSNKEWKQRCLMIYRGKGSTIKLKLDHMNPQELEQVLLAVELWHSECEVGENVLQLRNEVKLISSGENQLNYTDMWEEELRRRYCPTSFVPLEPGRTLKNGTLKVRRHLALGGLAAVYLCDLGENEIVVLKEAVIPEDAQESVKAKAKEMFEREARLLMKLENPGIVKVLDFFAEGGRNYLMLQYLNGQDIRQFVKQNGPQREHQVIDWGIKIANIMKYLHEQDPAIIHRDLTPDNLVITEDGSIVVIDFGAANEFIAKATGTLVGKQAYIAPEQFRGKAGIESDIYAFGCTLYYMLTGKEPEALSTSNPKDTRTDLSPEVCELIESCTQMEPEDRYRSAAQLIPVLRRISAAQAGV